MDLEKLNRAIGYDQLTGLLGESEVTREALHQAADRHEQENVENTRM